MLVEIGQVEGFEAGQVEEGFEEEIVLLRHTT